MIIVLVFPLWLKKKTMTEYENKLLIDSLLDRILSPEMSVCRHTSIWCFLIKKKKGDD